MIVYVMFLHWVADFVCQPNWMGISKSKSWAVLSLHVAIYTLVMSLGLMFCFPFKALLIFAGATAFLHFITDAITSRISSFLWRKKKVHEFFVIIGLDQLIHFVCLYYTIFAIKMLN